MPQIAEFDKLVGKIAGAIYSDVARQFPHPPLMLVPALTFKVRKIMEPITNLKLLSAEQKGALAKDMQISIVPMLFTYDIDADIIKQISPAIESAAYKALLED